MQVGLSLQNIEVGGSKAVVYIHLYEDDEKSHFLREMVSRVEYVGVEVKAVKPQPRPQQPPHNSTAAQCLRLKTTRVQVQVDAPMLPGATTTSRRYSTLLFYLIFLYTLFFLFSSLLFYYYIPL